MYGSPSTGRQACHKPGRLNPQESAQRLGFVSGHAFRRAASSRNRPRLQARREGVCPKPGAGYPTSRRLCEKWGFHNGGRHSAEPILPEYQSIGVGSVFPALPGAKDVFLGVQCEPEHSLVLTWRLPNGKYQTSSGLGPRPTSAQRDPPDRARSHCTRLSPLRSAAMARNTNRQPGTLAHAA